MAHHWLLTCTTYGTWLPGDARCSVTDLTGRSEVTPPLPRLERFASHAQKAPPVLLTLENASVLARQFRETAEHRGWRVLALAIMFNHFHVVLSVDDDPDPRKVLADLKAYGTRALNRGFGPPPSETWWSTKGSKRKLPDEKAIESAINYVLNKQPNPLVTWAPPDSANDSIG